MLAVRMVPKKAFWGILCEGFVCGTLKPSFATLTDIHYHDSHTESKLSVAVAVMSGPFRACGIIDKNGW